MLPASGPDTSAAVPLRTLSRRRLFLFQVVVALLALTVALATGEVALRIVYRDGGRSTSGGPGGQPFEYDYPRGFDNMDADNELPPRGPTVGGPKGQGVKRVAIYGDSITWGVGVRNWRLTYPAQLYSMVNAGGQHYDMHVMAMPGKSVDSYAAWCRDGRLDPDYAIYQWYVNDLEINTVRPPLVRPWQRLPYHNELRAASYLYYFLDNRLNELLPPASHFYPDFITRTFVDGTTGWATFRDALHRWVVYSTVNGARALVFLYPQVPFKVSPLASVYSRMRALVYPSTLLYPAAMFPGTAGVTTPDAGLPDGRVRQSRGEAGVLAKSRPIPLPAGQYEIDAKMRLDTATETARPVATLKVTLEDVPIAERVVDAEALGASGGWTDVSLPFRIAGALQEVRWELDAPGGTSISVDTVSIPVAYPRLDVLDLSDDLNRFDTHVSIFDAHPNARAHHEVATKLFDWVRAHP